MTDRPGPLEVTGGVGGVEAHYDDVARLGRLHDDLAARLREAAAEDSSLPLDGDLLASAPLARRTFLAAEAAVVVATSGPRGLLGTALEVEARALLLSVVVRSYRAADEAQRTVIASLQYAVGFGIGRNVVVVGSVTLAVGGGLVALRHAHPGLAGHAEEDLVGLVEHNPGLVELLAGSGGGLLDGLATTGPGGPVLALLGIRGLHPDTASAARDLGRVLYDDRRGVVDATPPAPVEHDAPRDVTDLVDSLTEVAAGDPGVVTVQRLGGEQPRWIVHLPGTDSFTDPGAIRGTAGNLALLGGGDTAYAEAVAAAMRDAGVGATDPVLVVGHSQGGMQAAALAADPELGHRITHVVTAGAPIAAVDVPDGVEVLALENSADAVPLLEGAPNRDEVRHVTVVAEVATGDLVANHDLATYGRIAEAVDAHDDPSLRAAVRSLSEAGFLSSPGEDVPSTTFTYRTRLE